MKIIDTSSRTTSHLDCLRSSGVNAIIRYYARTTQKKEKRLTQGEAEAILASGLKIGIICQSSNDKAKYFSRETGLEDGISKQSLRSSLVRPIFRPIPLALTAMVLSAIHC